MSLVMHHTNMSQNACMLSTKMFDEHFIFISTSQNLLAKIEPCLQYLVLQCCIKSTIWYELILKQARTEFSCFFPL